MMNSTTDEFGENPFRSGGAANEDLFFSSTPQLDPLQSQQPQQQFQPQFQQQPQLQHQQQQQFHQPPSPQGMFTQQTSTFPPPSGPMDNMAPIQQQPQMQMQPPVERSWWGNCMMCLSLDSYRAYFDVDADDIVTRIKAVFLDFYKPEHYRNNVLGSQKTDSLKGPDLYGPFWITMTLIFFIGVTSNMHDYLHKSDVEVFDYDINHLLHALSVLCIYSFVLPAIFWITTTCLSVHALLLVEWVCLYGYSLVPYFPAVMLCIIPNGLVSWIMLLLSTIMSCLLVVRNVTVPLLSADVGHAKSPPIILAILGTHIIFFLVLKFSFYHHKSG